MTVDNPPPTRATDVEVTETTVSVFGSWVPILAGGSGEPLVVLHRDVGSSGWSDLHRALATNGFRVHALGLPGYDESPVVEWVRTATDVAIAVRRVLHDADLGSAALLGLGFGGWIAAELLSIGPNDFPWIALQAPMGLKPTSGEIYDQFVGSGHEYVQRGFTSPDACRALLGEPSPDVLDRWEKNRETTCRIAWKPYMFSTTLAGRLDGIDVPGLVIHGTADRIVPLSCSERYASLLPAVELTILEDVGHHADLENPQTIARVLAQFAVDRRREWVENN